MQYAIFEGTPIGAVDYIQDIIEDKVVYEIGAGDGVFAEAMLPYAKKVVCIEEDVSYQIQCEEKGLDVIKDDYMNVNYRLADVIYIFMSPAGMYALDKVLEEQDWTGILISYLHPIFDGYKIIEPHRVIDVKIGTSRFPFLIYE